MNRREVLLLLAGTGALPDQLLAIGRTVHKRVRAGTLRALNAHQNETVATIAELIIPKTDTPGAREAGVPAFIDVMLADWVDDDQRRLFTAGLANVDERSRGLFAKDFVACSETSKNFFHGMKWLTLMGYYTSEVGATTELHYRVVPGRYEPCYPLDQ